MMEEEKSRALIPPNSTGKMTEEVKSTALIPLNETREKTEEEKFNDYLIKLNEGKKDTLGLFSSAYIYKVPEHLHKLNKSAYIPRIIAIGPLHCKDKRLQVPMQGVKRYYTNCLMDRLVKGKVVEQKGTAKTTLLKECMNKMRETRFIEKVKKYYATNVGVNDDQMVEMLLEDGCFILELLYSSCSGNSESSKGSGGGGSEPQLMDPILDILLTKNVIKYDLLLLENQIPFFVLEELFKLTVERIPQEKRIPLTELVLSYFGDILSPKAQHSASKPCDCVLSVRFPGPGDCVLSVRRHTEENEQELKKVADKDNNQYRHILHLIHDYYLPDDEMDHGKMTFTGSYISASELKYAGVKFTPFEGKNLFKVKFEEPPHIRWWLRRAEFKIPTLIVDESTESILRNLIALEQCCPTARRYFTSYAMFMDMLINSNKDVEVLKKAKVIHNNLGSDGDVSRLFNNLCKGIVTGEFYFNEHYQAAHDYSKHHWPKVMAYWKRTYHASPWKFKASLVAMIAFVIAVIQFIRSFLK